MPSLETGQSDDHKQYFLITNVGARTDAEIDLYAESWKLPVSIDDWDLTLDGKPLNMLYEENRRIAEHEMNQFYPSRDDYSKPSRKERSYMSGSSESSE
jgi:hypothetical protein